MPPAPEPPPEPTRNGFLDALPAWLVCLSLLSLGLSQVAARKPWRDVVAAEGAARRDAEDREAKARRPLPDEATIVARLEEYRAMGRLYWMANAALAALGRAAAVGVVALALARHRGRLQKPPLAVLTCGLGLGVFQGARLLLDVLPWLGHL